MHSRGAQGARGGRNKGGRGESEGAREAACTLGALPAASRLRRLLLRGARHRQNGGGGAQRLRLRLHVLALRRRALLQRVLPLVAAQHGRID